MSRSTENPCKALAATDASRSLLRLGSGQVHDMRGIMIRNFGEIPVESIAWSDTRFKLTFRRLPETLRFSVREVGVLNPLIVTESESFPGRYTIVTGWLRLAAAREDGKNSVPCHIYENFPNKILLLCEFFDNLGHRTMNPVELAITLKKLGEFYTPPEVIANFLPLLGYRPRSENWDKFVPLDDLPEEMKWGIAEGELAEQAALVLLKCPEDQARRVFHLLRSLRVSASVQREMSENFFEVWKRDDVLPAEIIEREDWVRFEQLGQFSAEERNQWENEQPTEELFPQNIAEAAGGGHFSAGHNVVATGLPIQFPGAPLHTPRTVPKLQALYEQGGMPHGLDLIREAQAVRRRLQHVRFPHLKAMEDAYNAELKSLKLPPEAKISPVPYFESVTQKLEVRFRSPEQLKDILGRILSAEERGLLARLFSVLKS